MHNITADYFEDMRVETPLMPQATMQAAKTKPERSDIVVYRGKMIESRHRVHLAVANAAGEILLARGRTDQAVFPRSAIKMLQAIPLVETGAAERFGTTAAELALACASHGGEPKHVDTVAAWLARLGLSAEDLECGAHPPSHDPSAKTLVARGKIPTTLHNNCSGKHAGMLTLAKHQGIDPKGYIQPDHPVQKSIAETLAAMTGQVPWPAPAIDGCGIPTFAVPLDKLATAMARFAAPKDLAPARADACRRLAAAMMQYPEMVAGEGRPCTIIMQALTGILVKTGAEGVYAAALPEHGLGLALKVEDGATRASSVALIALLDSLGVVDNNAKQRLQPLAKPVLRNHAGTVVGSIEPDMVLGRPMDDCNVGL